MTRTMRACTFLDKGGTGKTTTAAHLGVALARRDFEVLLIDLAGKQGDLAKHFGLWDQVREEIEREDDWPNVSTVFREEWDRIASQLPDATESLIMETDEGVDLIPAHPGLDGLDDHLGNVDDARDRYSRLDGFLTEYVDPLGYDAVLLDLPGLTNHVTYNGIWAARNVIAPVETGRFEAEQAQRLRQDVDTFGETYDVDVDLAMVMPNKVDARTNLADEYLETFEEQHPEAIVADHVPSSQGVQNAAAQGRTVFADPAPSNTAKRAREAFETNAEKLVDRLSEARVEGPA